MSICILEDENKLNESDLQFLYKSDVNVEIPENTIDFINDNEWPFLYKKIFFLS